MGGHSGWEQQVPAPPTASSPRFTGSLSPLLCRQANYKSSFSRGSSMLREYQVIQNRRLKARIRDPE